MIKKDIFNRDVKALFQASARDRIHRFLMAGDQIRGAVVHTTRMVNEMRANHDLGPLETLVLGQAYIASILMCSGLKGKERLGINIQCSGPVKGLDVEANVFGEVRGFLKTGSIEVEDPKQVKRLSSLFGAGFLTVTKYLEDSPAPYSGQVALEYGSIAEDLANYFLVSEQIPTGFKLSVFFDDTEEVTGAGGVFLQAMPGVDPHEVARAEKIIQEIESLGQSFAQGTRPQDLILDEFADLKPRFLDSSRVEFFCRCSREGMEKHLKGLPEQEKKDILDQEEFPLEVRCHNCNSVYRFTQGNIRSYLN
ncbi:Hsp33 family molecular chaperone HslO [Desulfospira joergensenii]|uniref:Hsp33 family molecular chaperone HslO n=1 Tax=Desulfospira joergensenii TaxID=53329 RepID=UPI0003B6DC7B|nr:Hsp33 family molecular chaperone HslO [Desulfospira joergensenii]